MRADAQSSHHQPDHQTEPGADRGENRPLCRPAPGSQGMRAFPEPGPWQEGRADGPREGQPDDRPWNGPPLRRREHVRRETGPKGRLQAFDTEDPSSHRYGAGEAEGSSATLAAGHRGARRVEVAAIAALGALLVEWHGPNPSVGVRAIMFEGVGGSCCESAPG